MSTVVIKLGSSSICHEETRQPRLALLASLVEVIVQLRRQGFRVILVSSGAVGMGRQTLQQVQQQSQSLSPSSPQTDSSNLVRKQALAAIGQGKLMALYDNLFGQLQQPVAQLLLTRHDIANHSRYSNARNTLQTLLDMGIVPIVNENDTVSVSEIRFGDNDTLSAITAAMASAKWLFLLTDVDGLYSSNPRTDPSATIVRTVENLDEISKTVSVSSEGGTTLGTGGMVTKLLAARLATAAGVHTVIQSSARPLNILEFLSDPSNPQLKCTHFVANPNSVLKNRKWWIVHGLSARGAVYIDQGARDAITDPKRKASLFSAGIVDVEGDFHDQEAISIKHQGTEVARGIVNYSSQEIRRVMGKSSLAIVEILGYEDSDCIIYRENLAVL